MRLIETVAARPAPRPAAATLPRLRIWPLDRLLLHEEPDALRVRRLADALRRDGVLRNPPIAAPLDDGRAVVLDGANRVTALRVLGLPDTVIQTVAYRDPGVRLSVWRHYVPESVPGALRAEAAVLSGARSGAIDGEAEAQSCLAAGALAAVVDAGGGVVLDGSGAGTGGAGTLRALAALYTAAPAVHRVEGGTLGDLRIAYGDGALVLFRRFDKSDIVELALAGDRLPAGITRHVIPGRALRLNTPLAWLEAGVDPAAKQAALDAQLQQRWQAHGVRHYAEPTFLFDE